MQPKLSNLSCPTGPFPINQHKEAEKSLSSGLSAPRPARICKEAEKSCKTGAEPPFRALGCQKALRRSFAAGAEK